MEVSQLQDFFLTSSSFSSWFFKMISSKFYRKQNLKIKEIFVFLFFFIGFGSSPVAKDVPFFLFISFLFFAAAKANAQQLRALQRRQLASSNWAQLEVGRVAKFCWLKLVGARDEAGKWCTGSDTFLDLDIWAHTRLAKCLTSTRDPKLLIRQSNGWNGDWHTF